MELTPDAIVFAAWGPVHLNATIVFTWAIDLLAVGLAWRVTSRLTTGVHVSRWQTLLELIVEAIRNQLAEIAPERPERFLPFVGTLFLFIAVSNALVIVPYYRPPTGSLSTTVALAICVFVAVPAFGIAEHGLLGYLRRYATPSWVMIPFNIIGEVTRTIALAIRLFGNIMSGSLIVAMIVALAPLFFPIVMNALGLLTGLIQAYIFAVLAAVYIASGVRTQDETAEQPDPGATT